MSTFLREIIFTKIFVKKRIDLFHEENKIYTHLLLDVNVGLDKSRKLRPPPPPAAVALVPPLFWPSYGLLAIVLPFDPGPEDAEELEDSLEEEPTNVALGEEIGLPPRPFTIIGDVTPEEATEYRP